MKLWRKDLEEHGVSKEDADYLESKYFSREYFPSVKDKFRTLKMTLTDGISNFEAFEFETCQALDLASEGDFYLLKPPLDQRHDMLFLRDENLEVVYSKELQKKIEKQKKLFSPHAAAASSSLNND